ncbi:MAG: T9SS type A sorting domain-containing protein [Bacteroidia bacterium]
MKNKLLTILLIISFSNLSKAQILNGGFENWNAGLPVDWWGVVIPPYNLLTQTNDAHSGSFAVKLQVEDLSGTAIASPLATGDGATTTHSLTYVPGSVSFWYKLNPVGGDYLSLTALVYSGGTGTGVAIQQIPAATNYTLYTAPIMYGGTVPPTADSIAIIFTIANATGSPTIGTEAKIDDISTSISSGLQSQNLLKNKWTINPNPADQTATVNFESVVNGNVIFSITNATGKMVYQNKNVKIMAGNNLFPLNTEKFKPGMYFCTIESEGKTASKSFFINHVETK